MLHALKVEFAEVDIDLEPSLTDRYGTRVPVIVDKIGQRELGFPFDPADVAGFVGVGASRQS